MLFLVPNNNRDFFSKPYLSPYGPVKSDWERTERGTHFTITVPVNCTAEICIGGRVETVTAGVYEYGE